MQTVRPMRKNAHAASGERDQKFLPIDTFFESGFRAGRIADVSYSCKTSREWNLIPS